MFCTNCKEPVPLDREKRKSELVAATCSDECRRLFRIHHRNVRRPGKKSPSTRSGGAVTRSASPDTGHGLHASPEAMRYAQTAVTE